MDFTTRVLTVVIVALAAFVTYLVLSAKAGSARHGMEFREAPAWDHRGDGNYASRPDRRLPPGIGNASADPRSDRQDWYDRRAHSRECWPNPRPRLGRWHHGAEPEEGGGRWRW